MQRIAVFTVALLATAVAHGQSPGVVVVPSPYPVAETVDRLESAVKAAGGFQIFARVDFQALAATQGGKVLPEQLLLFGRGAVLQPILPDTPVAAIDLPLKAVVWQDANGKVWLAYDTGEYLAQRHGVQGRDEVLKRITDVTAALARSATQ